MPVFRSIEKPAEGFYKEKGSKFYSFAFPVVSVEEVEHQLNHLRVKYHDARHVCYAYIIGLNDQEYRANDDGEPNHSAGDPILGQLRSRELTNCLVVVVRYFGGTKLGVGGLIQAYKTSSDMALETAKVIQFNSTRMFELQFSYPDTSQIERILHDFEIAYSEKNYNQSCQFIGSLPEEDFDLLAAKLERIASAKLKEILNR